MFFHLGEVMELSTSARSRISTTGADIIPKWEYIRTLSADVNELAGHRRQEDYEQRAAPK